MAEVILDAEPVVTIVTGRNGDYEYRLAAYGHRAKLHVSGPLSAYVLLAEQVREHARDDEGNVVPYQDEDEAEDAWDTTDAITVDVEHVDAFVAAVQAAKAAAIARSSTRTTTTTEPAPATSPEAS